MINHLFLSRYPAFLGLIFSIGILFLALGFVTYVVQPIPLKNESQLNLDPIEAELISQDLSESGFYTDTRRNTSSQQLEGIHAIQISNSTVNTIGLKQGSLTHEMLAQDSNNSTPYDNLTDGVFFITTTVSVDAYRLLAKTIDTSKNDFSLFVGLDSNENGMPDASEQLCYSSTPTAIEICELVNPASGTYWIMVQNKVASISPPDFVTLVTAVVYHRDHLEGTP